MNHNGHHSNGTAFDLVDGWKLVLDTARTREMPSGPAVDRLPIVIREALMLAADNGESGIARSLDHIESRDPHSIDDHRQALERARSLAKAGPKPFDLDLIDTETFFGETYSLNWLIKGLMVKDQPCVFGGPQKSLKTSILIDLAISATSGTPFLGRFTVPEFVPVALISGESGRAVIQANAKEICRARELPFDQAAGIHWGFNLPRLSNAEHMAAVAKSIGDRGLKLILLDPLYLALLAEGVDIDPKDMFQMGPLLADVAATCIGAGATPVLCHHFVKKRDDPFGAPDMGELAYAGIGQFMRQWMLTCRRRRYEPETGIHELYFSYGGSAGHSGELHLDIDTGRIDDELQGRRWNVSVLTPGEGAAVRQEQAKAEKERLAAEKLIAEHQKRDLKVSLNADKIVAALSSLGGVQNTQENPRSNLPLGRERRPCHLSTHHNQQGPNRHRYRQDRQRNQGGRGL